MGRRRNSSRHDGAAIVLVLGIVVVAAIWMYLLIVGAIALAAWLVSLSIKSSRPAVDGAQPPIPPPPPSEQYRPLVRVEPSAFDSPGEARRSAQVVFQTWLRQIPRAPRSTIDLVRNIEIRHRTIGRMTTDVIGRRFVWRSSPISGRHSVGPAPLDPIHLDPWNPPSELRRTSRHVAMCTDCGGNGRVTCAGCGGSARNHCNSCNGSGKYYGTTANGAQRILNCKECRGKGNVACRSCSRGSVDCFTCKKMKKLERWLEIDESSRHDVQVEPDGALTKAFVWGVDGVVVAPEQITRDARVVAVFECAGAIEAGELPAEFSDWHRDHWSRIQPHLQAGDRVRAQTLTLLEVPSTEVTYGLLDQQQTVSFEGLQMLAPPSSVDRLLTRRATILKRVQLALATLPLAAVVAYVARGDYFLAGRAAPFVAGVVGAALAVALFGYAAVWNSTLGRRAGRKWAVAALPAIAAGAFCLFVAEPSVSRAKDFITAGSIESAKAELNALGSPTAPELAPLWADIAQADALKQQTCAGAVAIAEKIDQRFAQRGRVIAHADSLALASAAARLDVNDPEGAASELACALSATRDKPDARALAARVALARSARCVASSDWSCALRNVNDAQSSGATAEAEAVRTSVRSAIQAEFDKTAHLATTEKDLRRRVDHETKALSLWKEYLAANATQPPAVVTTLERSKLRDDRALARQVEAERKRAAEQERQRLLAEERERRRQEVLEKRRVAAEVAAQRRAEAAERRRQEADGERNFIEYEGNGRGPTQCADGSWSHSSGRGTCSHHGGIR